MDERLLNPYDPTQTEDKIYKIWEESGFFNPDECIKKGVINKDAEKFSIVLPPPNVTGTLHIGHASMLAIEDIIVRYNRMLGKKTLWIPGTDHAAIATQNKVEKILYKEEKKNRHDIGREEFLKRVKKFAQDSHDTIVDQVKKMGSSIDWSREAYTLDEKRNLAVKTAFKKMYDDGLIYRGSRIVNWDPKMQTNVSDDEIEYKEEKTSFYYLKYGPFTIATARPETKFGDKYVVMHPDDKRYKEYKHGQKIDLEWINGQVTATIIKDDIIDQEFGTGVMTITPWHDITDFEIAQRHKLDFEQIIDLRGKLLDVAGEFSGVNIRNARPEIVKKLQEKGLLEKIEENYVHNIATNSRGGGIIEPQIMKQWFINVTKKFKLPHSKIEGIKDGKETTLKELMTTTIKNKQIKILPERFDKTYFHWVDNLRDWCISRQIWYGHRIPVWYSGENTYVGTEAPKEGVWKQDPDTLDTWFSSGLWTFSTLGWPEKTKDFETYHPTSLLETGYDILFFWVARMILMTTYLLGEIPFETIYLHGLVRDEKNRKMSKSLGNIIDPLDFIKKYGADAVRMGLIIGTSPGNDTKLSESKIKGYKHFANKIWNIARFVLSNSENAPKEKPVLIKTDEDYLKELETLKKEISTEMDKYHLYLAGEKLYQYVWHNLADKIIEETKTRLNGNKKKEKLSAQWTLQEILRSTIIMLHPFMPFITEEIWSIIKEKKDNLLIVTPWNT